MFDTIFMRKNPYTFFFLSLLRIEIIRRWEVKKQEFALSWRRIRDIFGLCEQFQKLKEIQCCQTLARLC